MAGKTLERDGILTDKPVLEWFDLDSEEMWGWGTVAPVVVLYLFVSVLPIGFAIYASFHDVRLLNPQWEFVGLRNYFEVLSMGRFWTSLWLGAVFMIGSTVLQLAVGLWMALVLNRISFGQKIMTAVVFTAYLVPTVIIVLVSLYMLDVEVGILHVAGSSIGLWEERAFALGQTTWAMPLIVLIGSWKFSVFVTIFTLAQLRAIPSRFYEAAKIAGATRWQMFRDITLPRIMGVLLIAVLLRAIFMFNKFDIIWMLTQGGPAWATSTLPILAYRTTFEGGTYGLGNAMAVVMFLFLMMGAVAYFKLFNPSEEVET